MDLAVEFRHDRYQFQFRQGDAAWQDFGPALDTAMLSDEAATRFEDGFARSFGFTGCDLHANWGDANQRLLVLNGILWAAKLDVPANGLASEVTPEALKKNWDRKVFLKKAAKAKP
mgnify:CR=1 FL=1